MKVSELSGAKLDYWVAKAEGKMAEIQGGLCMFGDEWFSPSKKWSQAGPIIEREKICIKPRIGTVAWYAEIAMEIKQDYVFETGESPLIAAMRCYVSSKFGEEVPDEPTL